MGQPSGAHPPLPSGEHMARGSDTQGSETSQYLQEEKSIEIPQVAASERGRAQTARIRPYGVVGPE